MLDLPVSYRFKEADDYYDSYYAIINKSGREICRVYIWVDGETEAQYLERVKLLVQYINN